MPLSEPFHFDRREKTPFRFWYRDVTQKNYAINEGACSATGVTLEVAIDITSGNRLQSVKSGRSPSDMQTYPQSKGSAKVLDVVPREWHYGNCT